MIRDVNTNFYKEPKLLNWCTLQLRKMKKDLTSTKENELLVNRACASMLQIPFHPFSTPQICQHSLHSCSRPSAPDQLLRHRKYADFLCQLEELLPVNQITNKICTSIGREIKKMFEKVRRN